VDLDLRSKDLDLQPMDLDLTISESEDLDLKEEDSDLNLPPWDLTTSLVVGLHLGLICRSRLCDNTLDNLSMFPTYILSWSQILFTV